MKHFDSYHSFEDADNAWDEKAQKAKNSHPLKVLKTLPKMPGITKTTAKHLKWKSLKYLLKEDKNRIFFRYFFKSPLKNSYRLIKSYLQKNSYQRLEDFFFYGISSIKEFEKKLLKKNTFFIIGFSYCHKPLECPSGRFTDKCIHDVKNPICQQCFIGKCAHTLKEVENRFLFIPTIHYIGEKIFDAIYEYPDKEVIFLITACEMTLKMFGDWGNMTGVKGIGVRLDGRICNTMKAFELSEKGIKPGLTVVLDPAKKQILDLLKIRKSKTF